MLDSFYSCLNYFLGLPKLLPIQQRPNLLQRCCIYITCNVVARLERTGCTPPKYGDLRKASNFLPTTRIQTQIIFSLFIASIACNSLFYIFLLNNFKNLFAICLHVSFLLRYFELSTTTNNKTKTY